MALMIPPILPAGSPSSERRVFSRLRDDPSTERWVVFHSVSVPLPRRRRREIDFLVLIPNIGILSLEVKGGAFDVHQDQWYRSNSGRQRIESPFVQAEKAMFGLKNQLTERFRNEWNGAELMLDYVVIFTDANLTGNIRDTGKWFIGERGLRSGSKPLAKQLYDIAWEARQSISDRNVFHFNEQAVVDFLKWMGSDLTLYVVARPGPTPYHNIEKKIIQLTDEQYRTMIALGNPDRNRRVLCTGHAGTGKTMLALKLAEQRVAAGERVALICYNRFLGDFLNDASLEYFNDKNKSIAGGIWYDFLYGIIGDNPSINDEFMRAMDKACDNNERFDDISPLFLEEALRSSDKFDYLIIDELQDMCAEPYLTIMSLALKGGLTSGRWAMFADFEQFTPDRVPDSKKENLDDYYTTDYKEFNLTQNVRNTRRIATVVNRVISATPANPVDLPVPNGPSPVARYWSDVGELRRLLDSEVRDLLAEGERIEDIVVLRPSFDSRSEHYATDTDLLPYTYADYPMWDCPGINFPPRDACDQRPCCRISSYDDKYLKFRSVRRFKGMESKIVILLVDNVRAKADRTMLYVGLTRARIKLVVLGHEATRDYFARLGL